MSFVKASIRPHARIVLYRLVGRVERVVIVPLLFAKVGSVCGSGVVGRTGPRHRAHSMRSDITIIMIVRGARAAMQTCGTAALQTNEFR